MVITETHCESPLFNHLLERRYSDVHWFVLDDDRLMNVNINKPDMVVDGEKKIMIQRNGESMTVHYGDLQIGDMYYFEDTAGQPRRYKVIDIGGTPSGNAEITTETVDFRMGHLYGSTV